jgi:hypothetical protein
MAGPTLVDKSLPAVSKDREVYICRDEKQWTLGWSFDYARKLSVCAKCRKVTHQSLILECDICDIFFLHPFPARCVYGAHCPNCCEENDLNFLYQIPNSEMKNL